MNTKSFNLNILLTVLRVNIVIASGFVAVCGFYGILGSIMPYFYFQSIGPALGLFLTSGLNIFMIGFSYFIGSYNLLKIIQTIKTNRPFDANNGKRLRIIGFTLLFTAVHKIIIDILIAGSSIPSANPILGGFGFDAPLKGIIEFISQIYFLNPLILALFSLTILAIAEVFIQGSRIKQEQDLTI